MTDYAEKISELLDEETGPDLAAAVSEVIADVNLQYRMQRYQMIGEAMRRELPPAIDTSFYRNVMAAIESQSQSTTQSIPPSNASVAAKLISWTRLKPFAGMAIAASVALLTIAIWQPINQVDNSGNGELASIEQQKIERLASQSIQGAAVLTSSRLSVNGTRWKTEQPNSEIQQKLNAYLVNHTEYSNSMQGLIPQARVAGFDAQ